MRQVKFNMYSQLKEFVLLGYSLYDLCKAFNMKEQHVKDMLSELREDLVLACNESDFYIIGIIDNLIGKYSLDKRTPLILDFLMNGNDCSVICSCLNINLYHYLAILKRVYTQLCLYDSEQKSEILVRLKKEIVTYDEVLNSDFYPDVKEKVVYPNKDRAMFGRSIKKSITSNSFVRNIYDIGKRSYIRMLAIADTHYGNIEENLDYLDLVYEYASKHGIHIILHGGDIIEGSNDNYYKCLDKYSTAESQVEHVLEDYLFDENIINLMLLGNHDASIFISDGIDLFEELKERNDLKPLGYRQALIKCGKEYISLKHEVPKLLNHCKTEKVFINLIGHSHIYRITHSSSDCTVNIPALSDVSPSINSNQGFLDIQIWFKDDRAKEISVDFIPTNAEQIKKFYVKKSAMK